MLYDSPVLPTERLGGYGEHRVLLWSRATRPLRVQHLHLI
jgi:hypothetical protein